MRKKGIFIIFSVILMGMVGCSAISERETEPIETEAEVVDMESEIVEIEESISDQIPEMDVDESINVTKDIPDEYKELFTDGTFDENMIWTTNKSEYQDLINKLKAACEEYACGSILLATDEDVILAGGWNLKEIDDETTVNPYTTYEIGSVTKTFMAAATLQLIEDGKLQTTDTLDKFFPEYPEAKKITIDNLLHMDSGIPCLTGNSMLFFDSCREEGKDIFEEREIIFTGEMDDEIFLDYFHKTELMFEPGTIYSYSNTNYILLAHILEQVTGNRYEDYINQHIFEVCKMENSTCIETGNITSVPVYGGEAAYTKFGKMARGAGDIHSNVCDLLLFDRVLLRGGILDETQLAYMTTPRNGYACGWQGDEDGTLYHAGATEGYDAWNMVFNKEDERYFLIAMTSDKKMSSRMIIKAQDVVEEYLSQ